jgi:molybdopterin converting factor small subunit
MSAKVMMHYPHLKELANNRDMVEVNGLTIGQCLDDLVRQFPDIKTRIFDKQGKLLNFITIYQNKESLRDEPDPLDKPVSDGDEIAIILLIAGG